MRALSFLITIWLSPYFIVPAQEIVRFGNTIEMLNHHRLKVYLSCGGHLIDQTCATYMRIIPLDSSFRIDGKVEDYFLNENPAGFGHYVKGVKHGAFKGFYTNNKVNYTGQYSYDIKTGTWKFYYRDGSIKKVIQYKEGVPHLIEFYDEKGKALVSNGFGKFDAEVFPEKLSCSQMAMFGNVRNGLQDGKWFAKDKITEEIRFTEIFRGGQFLEGRIENLNLQPKYFTDPKTTFEGFHMLEKAYYFADRSCAESPKLTLYKGTRHLQQRFYPELKQKVTELVHEKKSIFNGTAIIDLNFVGRGSLEKINLFSTVKPSIEPDLKQLLFEMGPWDVLQNLGERIEHRIFILVIDDNEVIIPDFDARLNENQTLDLVFDYEYGEKVDGEKVGVWSYFDEYGDLELKVNYTTNEILYFKKDKRQYLIKTRSGWEETEVDRPPMYLGSSKLLKDMIRSQLEYPGPALRNDVTGTALLSFIISKNGLAEDLRIIDDIGGKTKKEVEDALNSVPNVWVPAFKNGQPYSSKIYIAVTFHLSPELASSEDDIVDKPYIMKFVVLPEK